MSVWGTPIGKMAAVTGLSESYISRLLSGRHQNETFKKLREGLQTEGSQERHRIHLKWLAPFPLR